MYSVEAPIVNVGTASTVSVSTTAWTKVPAASSRTGRTGVVVNNPSTNTASMVAILSESSTGPTEATSIQPMEIRPADMFVLIPAADHVYVYLMSLHSAAESAHVQEVKQRT